jgi:amino acid transporter
MVVMVASIRDPAALFAEETPIAAFLRQTGGPKLAALVSGGVVLAIFNSLVANIMGYARYFYATGRDGIWPKPISALLGRLDGARRSPDVATALVAIVSGAATLFGEKSLLILLSGNVSDYLLISLAVLVGRPKGLTGAEFRAPLHPLLPVFGLGVTALSMLADWMDPEAGRPSVVLLTLLFASALLYFHVRLRQISTTWFKPAEIASAAFVKEPRA